MPKNLTGNSSLFPNQTSPVAGEPRTAGSVETPLQNAADRSQYLYDRLMFVDPTREGARRLRRFANLADLKAATDIPTGTVALVDGVGLYEYDSASTAAELSPVAIKPTTVGGGSGAWLVAGVGSGMLNVPNGVPQLDGAAKVPTSRLAASDTSGRIVASSVRNGIIGVVPTFHAAATTTSLSYADVTSFTLDMATGDWAIVLGQAYQRNGGDADTIHTVRWEVTNPSMVTSVLGGTAVAKSQSVTNTPVGTPIGFSFHASDSGTHTFTLRHCSNDGNSVTISNVNITAIQVRS